MNKAITFIKDDFPRVPILLFCAWILFLVINDLLNAFGVLTKALNSHEKSDPRVISHFVKFQTIELDNFNIMVGSQYQANDGSEPETQWCYAAKSSNEGTHSINITLAEKERKKPAEYVDVSKASANKLGLSVSSIHELAITHCTFL